MITILLFLSFLKFILFALVCFFAKADKAAIAVSLGLAVFELLNILYFFITLGLNGNN